jgi:hypothetical protein
MILSPVRGLRTSPPEIMPKIASATVDVLADDDMELGSC